MATCKPCEPCPYSGAARRNNPLRNDLDGRRARRTKNRGTGTTSQPCETSSYRCTTRRYYPFRNYRDERRERRTNDPYVNPPCKTNECEPLLPCRVDNGPLTYERRRCWDGPCARDPRTGTPLPT